MTGLTAAGNRFGGSLSFIRGVAASVWKVLSFSLGSDLFVPARSAAVVLGKGRLSIALASRSFMVTRLKGVRTVTFDEATYPTPDAVASSLALVLEERGYQKADIAIAVPEEWVVPAVMELPVTVKENLGDAVSFEIDRVTPFKADSAAFDFAVLEEKGDRISFLVHAAPMERIKPYLERLEQRRIAVTVVLTAFSALSVFFGRRFNGQDIEFVHVQQDGYAAALFRDGRMLRHAFDKDRETVTSALRGTTDRAERRTTALILTPEAEKESPDLPSGRHRKLSDLSEDRFLQGKGFLPFAAGGAALASLGRRSGIINLLNRGLQRKEKTPVGLTLLLLTLLAVVFIIYLGMPVKLEQARLDEINRQIGLRADEVKKVEALRKEVVTLQTEVDGIRNFQPQGKTTLDLLKEFTTILPKTAWLTRIRVDGSLVEVEGYAASATELLPKLEASRMLRRVQMSASTFRDPRTQMDRFMMKMEREDMQAAPQGGLIEKK